MKKSLSLLLSVALLICGLVAGALADSAQPEASQAAVSQSTTLPMTGPIYLDPSIPDASLTTAAFTLVYPPGIMLAFDISTEKTLVSSELGGLRQLVASATPEVVFTDQRYHVETADDRKSITITLELDCEINGEIYHFNDVLMLRPGPSADGMALNVESQRGGPAEILNG